MNVRMAFVRLLLALMYSGGEAQQCDEGYCMFINKTKEINMKRLAGHVLSVNTLSPGFNCLDYCALDCQYLSVNYKAAALECQLNSEDDESAGSALIDDNEYVFMAMTLKHVINTVSHIFCNPCVVQLNIFFLLL